MASYEKIVKYLVEKLQNALAPLDCIVRNQEVMIAQNKQIIDLLARLSSCRETALDQEQAQPACESPAEETVQP